MSALFIEALLKSSLLIGLAAAINLCLRRRGSAALRHLVWTSAIAALLALPLFLAGLPRWDVKVPVAPLAISRSAPRALDTTTVNRAIVPASPRYPSDPAPSTRAREIDASNDHVVVWGAVGLVAAYVIGVVLLLARLGFQHRAITRLARASEVVRDPAWLELLEHSAGRLNVSGPVRLLRSRHEIVPMAFGSRTPAILLPAIADTWDEDRRRAVLLHELAHIVRRDCATQTAAAVACAVYWIHPVVWWASQQLRHERELACDDRVIAAGTRASDYADHLLEIAYACVGDRASALAVSMARPSEIEGRLRALVDAARSRRTPTVRTRVVSAIVAIGVLALLAATRATLSPLKAQSPEPPADRQTSHTSAAEPRHVDPAAQAIAEGKPGTWEIWSAENGIVQVRISEGRGSSHSFRADAKQVEAVLPSSGSDGQVRTTLTRDAGAFTLEGLLRRTTDQSFVGAGTFTFTPSDSFPSELEKRGFARPTRLDQYLLARSDVGLAFIAELSAQRYARPDLALLVRAAEHGVNLTHLREMGQLGYHVGQVEALITQVDHGVSPDYVRELRAVGFTGLSNDDLVRTRDHGVDAAFVGEVKALGYDLESVEAAIRARDHGIDSQYIREMRELGYQQGTMEDLIKTRDHGIDATYVRQLSSFGYAQLPLDELVRTRDHGVDAEYIRQLREFGYQTTLASLINARDHGVDGPYIKELIELGYQGLTLDELIRLRDHGVDPTYIRELKTLGFNNASPDDLIRLRDSGLTRDRLKVELGYQFQRMRQYLQRLTAGAN
ncbi:MAG TPA: M56 family metallopeptidase [Vicinamibacterales bacterium]|jgi:beta-lactamase regulating signal transducer with metallopeptidase domain